MSVEKKIWKDGMLARAYVESPLFKRVVDVAKHAELSGGDPLLAVLRVVYHIAEADARDVVLNKIRSMPLHMFVP